MCAGTKKRRLLLLDLYTKRIKEAPPLPPLYCHPYEHKKKGSRPDYTFREILDRKHKPEEGQVLVEERGTNE